MLLDESLMDLLLRQAAETVRLRMNYDLRTSIDDNSQRMLNALLPETQVPVHRHQHTSETVFVLRGKLTEVFYDDHGVECARYELDAMNGCRGLQIPKGMWHTVIVNEPCVIFESKDGAFQPATAEDILEIGR